MKATNFWFESNPLVIDWLSLKFDSLTGLEIFKLAKYLSKLGFDSYQSSESSSEPGNPILLKVGNSAQVRFVRLSYSKGIALPFPGQNAAFFYRCIQANWIDWTFFSSGRLPRLDLKYSGENKLEDPISVQDFFDRCQEKLKAQNFKSSKNSKGRIFTIGNPKSNPYSGIYESQNSLKFEHEMKGRWLAPYHAFLVQNRLQELEQKLSFYFTLYFGKLLPLQDSSLDWLVIQ